MVEPDNASFGPHTAQVKKSLDWIDSGQLLRFGKPLSEAFIVVRENADASLHEVGLRDTPTWKPYKADIEGLLAVVADKVVAVLPKDYLVILDDVIADLHACVRCVAVHGAFDPFHERLWEAYSCGAWPCGCTGEDAEPTDARLPGVARQFYAFWRGSS
jgi:hypothetical protein